MSILSLLKKKSEEEIMEELEAIICKGRAAGIVSVLMIDEKESETADGVTFDLEKFIIDQLQFLKVRSMFCSDEHLKDNTEAMVKLLEGLIEYRRLEKEGYSDEK
ncbi:hypothetical protein [Enterococcus sp. LJL51]|uniref:hypothetical protein n=1 Tax=Enterococcus sp. LJL51 TaxID=3416656 RepID=UPI003CFACA03